MKSTNTETSKKVASILLDIGSVILRPTLPFKFDSGIISPVYVDNRCLISHPKEREIIISSFLDVIKKEIGIPDVLAGVATAGIPHAAWIAQKLNLPMIYVRSKPKDHGRNNQVEGVLKRGQKVLVVEDTVSTGGSSIKAIKAIRKLGGIVKCELAIYSHKLKSSDANFKNAKVKFYYLTDTYVVAKVANKKEFLKIDQIKIITDWMKDPKNWGKKNGFN